MPTEPANQGYVLPAITPSVSPVAAIVRAAAIAAHLSSHELPAKPRSIVDQQNLPCCVSCALGAAMEILNPDCPALAPLFHYYVTRFENGGANAEGFLFLDNGLATLTNEGICREELHHPPFTGVGAATKPSSDAYADALARALGRRRLQFRYSQVNGPSKVAWMRDQLHRDCPVVIGIQLPMTYPDSFLNSSFEWLDPESSPRSASGHCVLAFGYNDARQAFHIQDSRGSVTFERGCWWMGYRVADSSIVQDAYSLIP
jgi:hypothetical protein